MLPAGGLLAHRFDHRAHQVDHRVHQMCERLAVGRIGGRHGEVLGDVLHGRLQPVEAIVESVQVACGHDALVGRDMEGVGSTTGLVGPLTVRRAAEASGSTDPCARRQRTMAPPAPLGLRVTRHTPTVGPADPNRR